MVCVVKRGNQRSIASISTAIVALVALTGCSLFDQKKEEEIVGVFNVDNNGNKSVTSNISGLDKASTTAYAPDPYHKVRTLPKYINNDKFKKSTNYVALLNRPPSSEDKSVKGAPLQFSATPSGVRFADVEPGGRMKPAEVGTYIYCHLTGWTEDGTKFVSTIDRGVPFQFQIGKGQLLAGLEQGMAGMQTGGTRKIIVPPALAVGDRGDGKPAPPGKTLIYKVIMLTGGL